MNNCVQTTDTVIYGPYGWVIGPADTLAAHIASCKCGLLDSSTKEETKHTLTLLFKRDALIYDITNAAYIEGDTQPTDQTTASEKALRHTYDITEEGNADHVTRIVDLIHAICNERLYPYTKQAVTEDLTLNDDFTETPVYAITMTVPEKFSQTTALLLEKLIHQLIVWAALADWLSITKPNAADKWQAKAELALDEIKNIMRHRNNITLRPLQPW